MQKPHLNPQPEHYPEEASATIEIIEATEELSVFTVGRIVCAVMWLGLWFTTTHTHWKQTPGVRIDRVGMVGVVAVAAGLLWLMR